MKTDSLPKKPGCYLFKDSSDVIIYVGKAKNLNKRVSSYFGDGKKDPKTKAMISRVESVDFIVTENETESFILENNLIKKHEPKYNINLKDSKTYAYIQITDDDFPRLVISRNPKKKNDIYGPFVSASERDKILKTLRKTFKIRTCKKMPKKPCLRYHIDLCKAPCVGKIKNKDYLESIEDARMVLKGDTDDLIENLKERMKKASENLKYEKALELKKRIKALQKLREKQIMERNKSYNEDVINYIRHKDKIYVYLFNVYKGVLENKQEFEFEYHPGFFEEFLVQYYSENQIPSEVILPNEVSDSLILFLKNKRKDVEVVNPKNGEKRDLLDLVLENIKSRALDHVEKIKALRKALDLNKAPSKIECFDISHLSGTSTAGSMVRFQDGKPDKSNYRRFKIRTVKNVDDTKAIAEIVRRRYKRLKRENREMPDLIVLDGGKPQLNSALKELESLDLNIPTISIAKKNEDVFVPGKKAPLNVNGKALLILQKIRDEAHRFAIKYNKKLREGKMVK